MSLGHRERPVRTAAVEIIGRERRQRAELVVLQRPDQVLTEGDIRGHGARSRTLLLLPKHTTNPGQVSLRRIEPSARVCQAEAGGPETARSIDLAACLRVAAEPQVC